MVLSEEVKLKIKDEYEAWKSRQYADNTKEQRQNLGQFFTPPELTYKLIEKFTDMEGSILDPTIGCGSLIAGCIFAGADPKKCYGIEYDENILKVCQERLSTLGVPLNNIHLGDALVSECYEFPKNDEIYVADHKAKKYGVRKADGSRKFSFKPVKV